jgi:hypothetical protein
MSRAKFAALTLATTALAASGCGGSSKTGSTEATTAATSPTTPATTAATTHPTGTPLTRAALIAKGDAICARANAKTSVLTANSVQAFARVYPQIAIYNRTEAAELGRIVPPPSLAGDWARMIADLEQHSRYIDEVAHDIDTHADRAIAHPFSQAGTLIADLIETGKRDGFAHCSKLS